MFSPVIIRDVILSAAGCMPSRLWTAFVASRIRWRLRVVSGQEFPAAPTTSAVGNYPNLCSLGIYFDPVFELQNMGSD